MARPETGDAKPRWPWTEGTAVPSRGPDQPVGAPVTTVEEPPPGGPKSRLFRRGAVRSPEPDGVTWLDESPAVKALEAAEVRASRRRRPAKAAPVLPEAAEPAAPEPVVAAPTEPVPVTTKVQDVADEAEPGAAAGTVASTRSGWANPFRRKKDVPGSSPMEAASAAPMPAIPEPAPTQESLVTDTATQEQGAAEDIGEPPGRRIGWLGGKQVAVAVLVILAAEVGYIVHLNTSTSSKSTPPPRALPALSVPTPASSLPVGSLPVATPTTAPAPATKPASAPATTVPARTAAAVPATTVAAPPQPCTAADLSFTTTTDRASYTTGEPVVVVTKVTDLRSCVFTPTPPAGASCGASISVDYAGGGAAPMGPESCTPPASSTMNPGATATETATLPPGELSPGSYVALGHWGWSTGQGTATATPASPTFTVVS